MPRESDGRRQSDGSMWVSFNLTRLGIWTAIAVSVITICTWAAGCVASKIVTPGGLQPVRDSLALLAKGQETMTAAQIRQNARLNDMEHRTGNLEGFMEIVAIDVCQRRASDPYVHQRCVQYLPGRQ